MRFLVRQLIAQGCDVWAVSSTNDWVIRAGMRHFGIPRDHVLAASVEIENMRITDRLVRIPSGPGKPKAILDVVKKKPDAAFGNSRWDVDMLDLACSSLCASTQIPTSKRWRRNVIGDVFSQRRSKMSTNGANIAHRL